MQINNLGSVRVDLVGGTLDLEPINLIVPNVVTLNVATSLKAEVVIEGNESEELRVFSKDYDKDYCYALSDLREENFFDDQFFQEMNFIAQIIAFFKPKKGLDIRLRSGAPAGSGLGGSSAMGVTLFKGLLKYYQQDLDTHEIVRIVKGIEGRILNKGVPGYQDYYPALTGGVLGLRGLPGGIGFEQLYSLELKDFLEKNFVLAYSGISRHSGINNWEVYKAFFDGDHQVRRGLGEIAKISFKLYQKIKAQDFSEVPSLVSQEGALREELFTGITPVEVKEVISILTEKQLATGYKMCGAGGGGCFLIAGTKHQEIEEILSKNNMKRLDFTIEAPL